MIIQNECKGENSMILTACVDDRMGMLFNHRRVSQDQKVNENILAMCQNKYLYMEGLSSEPKFIRTISMGMDDI